VTVRQLLAMSSGLPADDPSIAGDPTILPEIEGAPDRIRASLGLPLRADPGEQWSYSNVSSDLLAAAVAEASGGSLLDFARERLFGPLGIDTEGAYEPVVVGWPPTPEQIEQYGARRLAKWRAPSSCPRPRTDPGGDDDGGRRSRAPAADSGRQEIS
jgi:CubicO group peptidase (beta-lactamase class C family)